MLSEGLATWAESVYDEFTAANPVAANAARMAHFTDNTTTNSVYGATLDTTSILTVFGNPSLYYKKAAMVINSLRFHVNNDEVFFQGIRDYQEIFGGATARATDFRDVMEDATGIELDDFFEQWYYKGGAPSFQIDYNFDGEELNLQVVQTTNLPTNPLYKTPLELNIQRMEGDTLIRLNIDANLTNHTIDCPGTITGLVVDPNQWITNGPSTITRVNEIDPTPFSIYPNPAREYIFIGAPKQEIVSIKIFDIYGKLCYSNDNMRLNRYIYIGDLITGVYFIQIDDKEVTSVSRLLVE